MREISREFAAQLDLEVWEERQPKREQIAQEIRVGIRRLADMKSNLAISICLTGKLNCALRMQQGYSSLWDKLLTRWRQ
jgi:hypothetical protein